MMMPSNGSTSLSVQDQIQYAQAVSKAGILPAAYRDKPADIVVALGLGQSMGLSPAESLYRINVIQGKPTASAELITANVRKAGHKLWTEKDERAQSVKCTIVRKDMPDHPISVTRDRTWAESMGLAGRENYRKQPMTMLTWRAITACAREACPEALYGVAYTPDEMHDMEEAPVQVEAVVEPRTERVQSEPEPVETKSEPEVPADGLQPVRELFAAYRDKLFPDAERSDANRRSTENILAYSGCESMEQVGSDPSTVSEVVAMMRDVIDFTDAGEVSF